jgi:hypothetical protein
MKIEVLQSLTMNVTIEVANAYRQMLTEVLNASKHDLLELKFDAQNAQQLAVAVIYATIVELADDCCVLLHQSRSTAVPGVLRSVLESYADLCAVMKDEGYIERMAATLVEQKLKLLGNMRRSPESPFHEDLAGHIDVEADIQRITAELAAYKERGYGPLGQYQRFEAAGERDIYESFYWQLCLHSHNNVAILERRHIRRLDEQRFEVIAFEPNDPDDLGYLMDSLIPILVDAGGRVHSFLGSTSAGWHKDQLERLQSFRREIGIAPQQV